MNKWVIGFLLLAFAVAFSGCDVSSTCPHGICDKEYYDKKGLEPEGQ